MFILNGPYIFMYYNNIFKSFIMFFSASKTSIMNVWYLFCYSSLSLICLLSLLSLSPSLSHTLSHYFILLSLSHTHTHTLSHFFLSLNFHILSFDITLSLSLFLSFDLTLSLSKISLSLCLSLSLSLSLPHLSLH